MKIIVQGSVIDIDVIWEITPVHNLPTLYSKHIVLPPDNEYWKRFSVKMFNDKSLDIIASVFDLIHEEQPADQTKEQKLEYMTEKTKELSFKLNCMRDEVIKYWSNNQSNIPQINF